MKLYLLFDIILLSTYYVPRSILDIEDTAVRKIGILVRDSTVIWHDDALMTHIFL